MACGTPVVATRAGALPEVVGEEGAGMLVPARDSRALARAIGQILDDVGEGERMARAGRERVESLFSWRSVAERTVEVYKELTG
jgi:glycosyltransferase involved in cell wall biosynthesis